MTEKRILNILESEGLATTNKILTLLDDSEWNRPKLLDKLEDMRYKHLIRKRPGKCKYHPVIWEIEDSTTQ